MANLNLSKKARTQMILRALLAPILMIGLLFFVAGRWDYWQAWVYSVINMIIFAVTTPLYMIALVVAGLDARFGWTTNMPLIVYWAGVFIYLFGQAIFLWARYTNNYFSSVVRIQTDRGQTVCKEGPYRFVRHPGYVGGVLFTVTIGIVLGSRWASIPQVIAALMLVWRTAREDKTLQVELPGYAEFTKETKYRLVPGVW
jgi:protein-S-isoprenylcysteine O-methyltransferase Ste14